MRWAAMVGTMLVMATPAFAQCETPTPGEPLALSRPLGGSIVREFGETWSDVLQKRTFNNGIDFEAQASEPVYAALGGTVTQAGSGAAAPVVLIDHGGGLTTAYIGLGVVSVSPGSCIKPGEQIGTAGGAQMVHFELRRDGKPQDPTRLLQ